MFPFPPSLPHIPENLDAVPVLHLLPQIQPGGSGEVTQPDGAGRPGSTCYVISLISVLGAPWLLPPPVEAHLRL